MSAKVEEFKKRCASNSRDDKYWLELERDFEEFWKTATREEKDEWLEEWGCGEILHMMCSGIRYKREQSK